MEIILNVSNHPIYTTFTRKALLKDLTFNNNPQQIIFTLEVTNYLGETVITELTKKATFIADSIATMNPPTSDIDLIMSRISDDDSFLDIVSDAVAFLDVNGTLNQRLGIEIPIDQTI